MGSSASTPFLPLEVDEAAAVALAGDKFDRAMFDAAAKCGKISRDDALRIAADKGIETNLQKVEFGEWATVPSKLAGRLVTAQWGSPEIQQIDVTSTVARLMAAGSSWQVTNDAMGGDPCVGRAKNLCLLLQMPRRSTSASQIKLQFKEWERVPAVLDGILVEAVYGEDGGHAADVTPVVELKMGHYVEWEVTNDAIGCDPCPGRAKVLTLTLVAGAGEAVTQEFVEHSRVPCDAIDTLLEAAWGTEDRSVDVRGHVEARLSEPGFRANNETLGGDPCPGLQKQLRVKFVPKRRGESACPACAPERPRGGGSSLIVMVEAWEGETLTLPAGSVGAIAGCSYGASTSWVNPRKLVEACVAGDGSLSCKISNDTLGGDPCPGKKKSLRVSYTIHASRRLLADEGEWEVHEAFDVHGINFCMGGPAMTEADLILARRRCLLLGCGGFRVTTGTMNQFGEQDGPPGCEQFRFTQDEIRVKLKPRPSGPTDSHLNRALRPGIHIAPSSFLADTMWRPGNDPAPAPWVGFRPRGRFCAVATQLCVPPEGVAECTYYMFGGFQVGYGGLQQAGSDEQILTFSAWNAEVGRRVESIEAGPGGTPSNFGGEGMGCGYVFDKTSPHVKWIPGNTYTWLLRALPDDDATIFTAHIFKPEAGSWQLVGKLRRHDPAAAVQGKLDCLGGFMEDTGHTAQRRFADYGPCWVQRATGAWEAVTHFEAGDGCDRPNKAVQVTDDRQRVRLVAGGPAFDPPPKAIHIRGDLAEVPPPDILNSAPCELPGSGWACGD